MSSLDTPTLAKLKSLTEAGFEQDVLNHHHDHLVLFWSPWSKDCMALMNDMKTYVETYGEAYSELYIGSLNIEENPILSIQYNICTLPALVHFKDGAIHTSYEGYLSKHEILEIFDSLWAKTDDD